MNQSVSRRDIVRVIVRRLLDEPQNQKQWLERLAAYIVTHGMTDKADLIVNDIAHELHVQAGLLTVEVVSARELTEAMRTSLRSLLQQQSRADRIIMHESTDSALVGGFVARTADAEIDASVRTKLQALAALA